MQQGKGNFSPRRDQSKYFESLDNDAKGFSSIHAQILDIGDDNGHAFENIPDQTRNGAGLEEVQY